MSTASEQKKKIYSFFSCDDDVIHSLCGKITFYVVLGDSLQIFLLFTESLLRLDKFCGEK